MLAAPRSIANMAAPLQPGAMLGEPNAALARLSIEREKLEIDLRALAADPDGDDEARSGAGKALISASYLVRNDSADRPLTLEFVAAASDTAQWSVSIDGVSIAASYTAATSLPTIYRAPVTTPGLDGTPIEYEAEATGIIRFTTNLLPGRHTIRVEYVASATRHRLDHRLVHWQLAYILAPARQWPSFGGLELSVIAPSRWSVATNVRLAREGDVLRGEFASIPDDALTITARAPDEWWFGAAAWAPAVVVFALLAIAALRAGSAHGRTLARAGRGVGWAIPAAFGAGFVMMVLVPAARFLGAAIEESLVGAGQLSWGGYELIFVQALVAVASLLAGFTITLVGAVRSIRRSRRRYDPRWLNAYDEGHDSGTSPVARTNGVEHRQP
jgi:hypothetical protein